MASNRKQPPGNGVLGWLGRQVGYVVKAVKEDPASKTLYRNKKVEEIAHPDDPTIKLRRTVIDEAVADQTKRAIEKR